MKIKLVVERQPLGASPTGERGVALSIEEHVVACAPQAAPEVESVPGHGAGESNVAGYEDSHGTVS